MIELKDIRYVRLGTRDVEQATEYAQKILGLELVRQEHGACYFRSDNRDHTLVYFEGDLRDHTIAFELANDPTGNSIDLVLRPHHSRRRYFPSRDAGITGFSHVGLRTSDQQRDEQFWTQLMNARVSDRIGAAPLLRIDGVLSDPVQCRYAASLCGA